MKKFPSQKFVPNNLVKKPYLKQKKEAKTLITKTKLFRDFLKKRGLKVTSRSKDLESIIINLESLAGPSAGVFGDLVLKFCGLTSTARASDDAEIVYSSTVTLNPSAFMISKMNKQKMSKMGDFVYEALQEVKRYRLPGDKRAHSQFLINFQEEIETNKTLILLREQIKKMINKF